MAGRGRDFLDAGKAAAVRRLLAKGAIVGGKRVRLSQRAIARRVGVSHTTVQAIDAGRWGVPRPKDPSAAVRLSKPRRCAAGHLVNVWPCVICAAAAADSPAARRARRLSDSAAGGQRNYRRR